MSRCKHCSGERGEGTNGRLSHGTSLDGITAEAAVRHRNDSSAPVRDDQGHPRAARSTERPRREALAAKDRSPRQLPECCAARPSRRCSEAPRRRSLAAIAASPSTSSAVVEGSGMGAVERAIGSL